MEIAYDALLLAVFTVAAGMLMVVAEATPTLTVYVEVDGLSQVSRLQSQFAAVTWTDKAVYWPWWPEYSAYVVFRT